MAGTNVDANVKLHFCIAGGAAVADFDGQIWIADGNYELIDATERHAVAGAAADISVVKVPSGTAKDSGTLMLASAGFSAAGVANTNSTIQESATQANRRVARGDGVGIKISGASLALDGVSVTVRLRALAPGAGMNAAGDAFPE